MSLLLMGVIPQTILAPALRDCIIATPLNGELLVEDHQTLQRVKSVAGHLGRHDITITITK